MSSPLDDLADVAVIGGSGFYSFLDDPEQHRRRDAVRRTRRRRSPSARSPADAVAFLPRHGADHEYPPHLINYRANLWALRSLGVRQVLAPCAVGGLRPEVAPGDIVVPDQLVDRTWGRVQTLRRDRRRARAVRRPLLRTPVRAPSRPPTRTSKPGGAMVVIEGPRFSTRAESQHYAAQGWSLVNMTGHPEAVLAREMRQCYAAIALVTDMDAGVEAGAGVGQEEVFAMFAQNLDRLKRAAHRRHRRPARPGGLLVRDLGRRHRPDLRGP